MISDDFIFDIYLNQMLVGPDVSGFLDIAPRNTVIIFVKLNVVIGWNLYLLPFPKVIRMPGKWFEHRLFKAFK
jgi:hypothetical protein